MLDPNRETRFTASAIHRLMADGVVDWQPEREGGRGMYHCYDIEGEFFETVALFNEAVKAERQKRSVNALSKGAMTYAEEVALASISRPDAEYELDVNTIHIRRGNNREPEAVATYEFTRNVDLINTGENQKFIVSHCGNYGATPDGRWSNGGNPIDTKCPSREHHLNNILYVNSNEELKKIHPVYYWQMQCQIAVTEAEWGEWISFQPFMDNFNAQLHVIRIHRNQDDIDLMLRKIKLAADYRDEVIERVRLLG